MIYLGKYLKMPPTFKKLQKLEEVIEKEGYSLCDLDLCLQLDFPHYEMTPYDVIPFANIGCDGIHYGFLTDFGRVSDLENAFIVCISPMDDFDAHIKIVARNIREFVSLVCTMKSATEISNFNLNKEEERYISLLKELKKEENMEYVEQANYVVEKIRSTIGCEIIENVYQYVEKEVMKAREEQTMLSTLDGIGIASLDSINSKHYIYKLEKDIQINLDDVKSFFNSATTESKLVFIRDAQFTYLISDDIELKELVINEMIKLGLNDEAGRLERI
ncbi:hypothetical protein [Peribacillus simplex]|uniref:SMI1/KNR4 family protein n=2 Tax=Peribacillus simplex TaxID=1478 RepID=A0A223EP09_9BACI|nr:hypothetical protein [Peribacillus simplex]ASS96977.1 hypothetical protein BS1321_25600 [Peribacillus simplex NBRC 15720 = DSM 1321]MEC1398683.1 hypothetical protein [Peribacillus simplex]MED3911529.1 hypothetical protein [Peribacillus simplex]TVX83829.1 hypothetical protein FQP34_00895 [Peribacillus simplex]